MRGRYQDRPCVYCGKVTGENEGENVVPRCVYPRMVDPKLQWVKVSCCPTCNDGFQLDEAHFRGVMVLAGARMSPERGELWERVKRSFANTKSGRRDLHALLRELVPVVEDGRPGHRIYPGNSPRALSIVKKIVRGLTVYRRYLDAPVAADRVLAEVLMHPIPPGLAAALTVVYEVKGVVKCQAALDDDDPEIHSVWIIDLVNVRFIALVWN